MRKVLCIMGPTAVGKSKLALDLADILPIEIVSVDSANVYQGLDIGSAKPSIAERQQVPHHLINICDPSQPYSAGDFYRDCELAIQNIFAKNKLPVLVGGTMLYFKAIQMGLSDLPTANQAVREKINAQANVVGWSLMHEKLKKIDAETAGKIEVQDAQRIQRALEVIEITGMPLSEYYKIKPAKGLDYHFINFAILPDSRDSLHQGIETRFQAMLEAGFLTEVAKLYQRSDLHAALPAMRAVGYRQAWSYLAGEYDYSLMCEKALAATKQLAKRQLTWLRSWPSIQRFDSVEKKARILTFFRLIFK